jgi:hypothetical protein
MIKSHEEIEQELITLRIKFIHTIYKIHTNPKGYDSIGDSIVNHLNDIKVREAFVTDLLKNERNILMRVKIGKRYIAYEGKVDIPGFMGFIPENAGTFSTKYIQFPQLSAVLDDDRKLQLDKFRTFLTYIIMHHTIKVSILSHRICFIIKVDHPELYCIRELDNALVLTMFESLLRKSVHKDGYIYPLNYCIRREKKDNFHDKEILENSMGIEYRWNKYYK